MAATTDKYELYTAAFQNPDAESIALVDLFQVEFSRRPVAMREDFCGTAANCISWVCSAGDRVAFGIDIDPEPLAWCQQNILKRLTLDEAHRCQLRRGDSLEIESPKVDLVLALNSSVCIFKKRELLLRYLRRCSDSLSDSGIVVLEVYAGPDAQMSGADTIECDGFAATWEQVEFNAVTNEALNRIHFELSDGTRLECAFEYDYRLWTPAELREALLETGFHDARVFRKDVVDKSVVLQEFTFASVPEWWNVYVVGYQ